MILPVKFTIPERSEGYEREGARDDAPPKLWGGVVFGLGYLGSRVLVMEMSAFI